MKKTYTEKAGERRRPPQALTSTQAATLLQVHESSIKRWSNQGDLSFSKTSGGHRRFAIEDLLSFAHVRGHNYPFERFGELQQYLCEALVRGWQQGHLESLRKLLSQWLQSPLRQHFPSLFQILYREYSTPLPQLFDQLLFQLMSDVGTLWQEGRLSVGEEHLISQVMVSSLERLHEELLEKKAEKHSKPLVGIAITAGAEGSLHSMGAFAVRLVLEEHGWEALYPGGNLPTAELAMMQLDYSAQLICLSFVKPQRLSDVHRALDTLKQMYDEDQPYALVVGGSALDELGHTHHAIESWFQNPAPFKALVRLNSIIGFERWLSEYKEQM